MTPDPVRTSITHPLAIDWARPGLGLTMCPGRVGTGVLSGIEWRRALPADAAALAQGGASTLVCLLETHELPRGLGAAVKQHGVAFRRFSIPDAGLPACRATFGRLVAELAAEVRAGRRVVVHCMAGLGRTGTLVGCVLRALGATGPEALATLAAARGPRCPETEAQRAFILGWDL